MEGEGDAIDEFGFVLGFAQEQVEPDGVPHHDGVRACREAKRHPGLDPVRFGMGESVVEANGQGVTEVDHTVSTGITMLGIGGQVEIAGPIRGHLAQPNNGRARSWWTARTQHCADGEHVRIVADPVVVAISRPDAVWHFGDLHAIRGATAIRSDRDPDQLGTVKVGDL